jgi:biopolymer transport protein ExbB/TolQ
MINLGDALFAVAFGLIAAIFLHFTKNSDTEHFFDKMHKVIEFTETF